MWIPGLAASARRVRAEIRTFDQPATARAANEPCAANPTRQARAHRTPLSGPRAVLWPAAGWLLAAEIRCLSLALLASHAASVLELTSSLEHQPAEGLRLAPSAPASKSAHTPTAMVTVLHYEELSTACFMTSTNRFVDSCSCLLLRPSWRKEHNYRCQVKISLYAAIILSLSTSCQVAGQGSQVRLF